MRLSICSAVVATTLFLVGCGGGSEYAADAEGLKALAKALDGNRTVLMTLQPTLDDCKAIAASDADAQKLFAHANNLYAGVGDSGIGAKEGQTDIVVGSATVADLKAGKGGDLPGGYAKVAAKLRDDVRVWLIRYVKPGQVAGMRFDGFVHVGGRWVFAPKFWRALS